MNRLGLGLSPDKPREPGAYQDGPGVWIRDMESKSPRKAVPRVSRSIDPEFVTPGKDGHSNGNALQVATEVLGVTKPEVALVALTRVALGVGIGLLVSQAMGKRHRLGVGFALCAFGIATTVPLFLDVFGDEISGKFRSK